MTDNELESVYKANIATSHFAGLRGVFDAGYALGAALPAQVAQTTDPSSAATVTDTTVAPVVDPNIQTV